MFRGRLLFALVVLVLCCCVSSHGKQNQHSSISTSCGDLHDISFPFRLKTNQSDICGLEDFELSCENNRTALDFNPGNTTCKRSTTAAVEFALAMLSYRQTIVPLSLFILWLNIIFCLEMHTITSRKLMDLLCLSCENAAKKSPLYIDVPAACENASMSSSNLSHRHFSYVVIRRDVTLSDIGNLCSVDVIVMITRLFSRINKQNISFLDTHNVLVHGFELEWSMYRISYKDCIRQAKCFNNAQNPPAYGYFFLLLDVFTGAYSDFRIF